MITVFQRVLTLGPSFCTYMYNCRLIVLITKFSIVISRLHAYFLFAIDACHVYPITIAVIGHLHAC